MAKILLTDCWTRKTLSAVRSLGREGVDVYAVTHKRLSPAIYSRYVKRAYIFPGPATEPEKYLQRILELIRTEKFDCIMPFEESSIDIFLKARKEIEQYTRLPIASEEAFYAANSKWEVLQLAKTAGVPVPVTFLPAGLQEAEEAMAKLGFPLIIKPVSSSGSRGLKKIYSKEEFQEHYNEVSSRYGSPLVQECIPQEGEGVGVGVLAEKGKVLVSFSYRRLREFPVGGGPGTLRESTDDSELKNYAARLIAALNWDGVAMVEFKRDPRDGKPKLMEVNPRFWGSLHLAYVSGVNFPYLLYQWSRDEKIQQPAYKRGVLCRWLLPGDVAHFLANPGRFRIKPSFFRFRGMYYDDFMKGDVKGNIASVCCALFSIFDTETWKKGVFRK